MRVIFLDLDRTLIGDDYSPQQGEPVVRSLLDAGFEVVLNSSKTRTEQEYYRKTWGLKGPFIVENGSAILIPEDYFPSEIIGHKWPRKEGYLIAELGKPYPEIKGHLDTIAPTYGLKYYGNSTLREIMEFTGLPENLAKLATEREYSETIFRWEREGFEMELNKKGLKVSRGSRFIGVTGDTDKGRAAKILLDLYSLHGPVESYAVGDGENDFPLFDVVDKAFMVGNLFHPKAMRINSIEELLGVIS